MMITWRHFKLEWQLCQYFGSDSLLAQRWSRGKIQLGCYKSSDWELSSTKEKLKKTSVVLLLIGADHWRYSKMKNVFNKTWQSIPINTLCLLMKQWVCLTHLRKQIRVTIEKRRVQSWQYCRSGIYSIRNKWITLLPLWKKEHFAWTCQRQKKKLWQSGKHANGGRVWKWRKKELGYIYHQHLMGLTWKTCLLIDNES